LAFSDAYSQAVESKQVAQQEAERAKYVKAKAEQEKRSTIIRAQGEGAAIKLVSARLLVFVQVGCPPISTVPDESC